jgi:PAS domain S-box-containing protein
MAGESSKPPLTGEGRVKGLELTQFKRALRQVLILPVVALLLLASVLIWQIHGARSTVDLIDQSNQRITLATLIERLVVDQETGLRGYQVTGDERFLQPYTDAEAPMQQAIATLQAMGSAGTAPDQDLKAFVAEHQIWQTSFAEPLILMIGAGALTNDVALNTMGKERMDSMRADLRAIVDTASQRRDARIDQWHRQVRELRVVLILLALAIGIGIGRFTQNRLENVSAAFLRSLDLQRLRTEELFDSEQYLRTTLASIGDGVIACDTAGRVQMMNPVAQELTGWLDTEARNRPLEEIFRIVDELSRQPVENPVNKVRRLNGVVGIANHTVLVRKDGSELSIDDSAAPIRNKAGEIAGVVMVFRDVTMERRTRAALLANEKLAVAGRLAATIAHEIHNPLDSVANLLYLLQTGSSEDEAKDFLMLAQSELARVTQISRAMLSLYRESRAPVPVNLKELLDGLLLLMERRFHELGVTVSADLPGDITVDGFPAELRQVFTNLLANAAEAAGQGGTVKVRVTSVADELSEVPGREHIAGAIVEITDSGPGITPEVREHLFQPFFTTKGERGTGLGLWVSQGIIRKHAGTLTLYSPTEGPTHGTTASVFLASKPLIDAGD